MTKIDLSVGVKEDGAKARMDLIDPEFLFGVARVLTLGAKKYAPHNWRKGLELSRCIAAALRHITDFNGGQDRDPETNELHLYHAACCLMFASNLLYSRPDLDDRFKPSEVRKAPVADNHEAFTLGDVASAGGIPKIKDAFSEPPFNPPLFTTAEELHRVSLSGRRLILTPEQCSKLFTYVNGLKKEVEEEAKRKADKGSKPNRLEAVLNFVGWYEHSPYEHAYGWATVYYPVDNRSKEKVRISRAVIRVLQGRKRSEAKVFSPSESLPNYYTVQQVVVVRGVDDCYYLPDETIA